MMRLFLISLGVTCLASVILFLYFRNRIGRMEQKVDLMFQLTQELVQAKNISETQAMPPTHSRDEIHQMMGGGSTNHDDLISVSDDDEERDSDSEEISDNESGDEEEPINIQESVANVKSIKLDGAEIESLVVEPADDLDDISDLEDNEVVTLEESVPDEIDEELESEHPEIVDEEITEEVSKNVSVKKIEVDAEKPLDKMTVKELKAKAEKDGFTNFKGLRKDKLVKLLTSQ
tara:strand:- start:733 stop:1431 length:699 start_codon:yes stop_codon:yes gene_type:complete